MAKKLTFGKKKQISGTNIHLTIIIIVFISLLISCKKDPGPQGPAGPVGPAGNANVQEFTFNNQSYAYHSSTDYELILNIPAITQDVQNTGAIMIYVQPSSNTSSWIALPFTINGSDVDFITSVGSVTIVSTTNPAVSNVKVVVIPHQ